MGKKGVQNKRRRTLRYGGYSRRNSVRDYTLGPATFSNLAVGAGETFSNASNFTAPDGSESVLELDSSTPTSATYLLSGLSNLGLPPPGTPGELLGYQISLTFGGSHIGSRIRTQFLSILGGLKFHSAEVFDATLIGGAETQTEGGPTFLGDGVGSGFVDLTWGLLYDPGLSLALVGETHSQGDPDSVSFYSLYLTLWVRY